MAKISLKSIQNNNINEGRQVKPKTKQKPVKNVEIPIDHSFLEQKQVLKQNPENKLSFSDILTGLQKNVVENNENLVNKQPIIQNDIQVEVVRHDKPLLEHERNKLIGLLHLYISEFPDKLKTYKGKNFTK
jgi:hypothetical protein